MPQASALDLSFPPSSLSSFCAGRFTGRCHEPVLRSRDSPLMDDITAVAHLIVALVLGTGLLLSMRGGVFSPHFLFFAYLLVGVVLRGWYLTDLSIFDDKDFWPTIEPLVRGDYL